MSCKIKAGDKVLRKGEVELLTVERVQEYETTTKKAGTLKYVRLFFVERHPTASDVNVVKVVRYAE